MKPLKGIRVLDLTHAHAGPICAYYLGAMGADVVKIEPLWGEMTRMFPPLVKGLSPYFAFLGRCKRGVTLDLKKPRGKELFEELVKKSDVVLENFSPGTMDRLGLGWDRLRELNPGIVYASISGFGHSGPWRDYRSYDPIAQAASGFMWLMRDVVDPEGDYYVAPEAIADTVPGFTALIGILAALYNRHETGVGDRVDVAQMDSMIAIQQSVSFWNLAGMTFTEAIKGAGPSVYGLYEACDGWVMLSLTAGRITDNFMELSGIEELAVERIAEWVKQYTVSEVIEVLSRNGVPVAPVDDLDMVQENVQARARGMFVEVDDPRVGKHLQPGFPLRFGGEAMDVGVPAPGLGEHNLEVFGELLGLSVEEVEQLHRDGVV
ncbi:CoA transferase [archaeon]|nr:CoA transferase [archaeon]